MDERARRTRGSKGVHIGVPRERVGNRDALTLISPVDGRVMFCLPAGSQAIIGTTDTWTDDSPETVHASVTDVDYLIRSANAYFPRAQLTQDDVVSAWAGIRPLAATKTANPSAVSREHSIVTGSSGSSTSRAENSPRTDRWPPRSWISFRRRSARRRSRRPRTPIELPGADRAKDIARCRTMTSSADPLVEGLPYTGAHLVYGLRTGWRWISVIY